MQTKSIKQQAGIFSLISLLIKGLGFVLRIVMALFLTPQTLGVYALMTSFYSAFVTPFFVSFTPSMSTMTALEKKENRLNFLYQCLLFAGFLCLFLMPLFISLCPFFEHIFMPQKAFLPLLMYAPCILLSCLLSLLHGYFLGQNNVPSLSLGNLIEQIARLLFFLPLLIFFPFAPSSFHLFLAPFTLFLSQGIALLYFFLKAKKQSHAYKASFSSFKKGASTHISVSNALFARALPLILSSSIHALFHALSHIIIPLRLTEAGLSSAGSLSLLGMFFSSVMPVLFMPALFFNALSAVITPKISTLYVTNKASTRVFCNKILCFSSVTSCLITFFMYWVAPFLGTYVFKNPLFTAYFRYSLPLLFIFCLKITVSAFFKGMFLQKKLALCAFFTSPLSFLLIYVCTALPSLQLYGTLLGMIITEGISLCFLLFLYQKNLPNNHKKDV